MRVFRARGGGHPRVRGGGLARGRRGAGVRVPGGARATPRQETGAREQEFGVDVLSEPDAQARQGSGRDAEGYSRVDALRSARDHPGPGGVSAPEPGARQGVLRG